MRRECTSTRRADVRWGQRGHRRSEGSAFAGGRPKAKIPGRFSGLCGSNAQGRARRAIAARSWLSTRLRGPRTPRAEKLAARRKLTEKHDGRRAKTESPGSHRLSLSLNLSRPVPISVQVRLRDSFGALYRNRIRSPVMRTAECEHLQRHGRKARPDDVQPFGGRIGEIDDASGKQNAAVVDAYHDGALVIEIDDAHHAAEGKGWMTRRHREHVEALAARGTVSVEHCSVPGRDSAQDVWRFAGRGVDLDLRCKRLWRSCRRQRRTGPGERNIRLHRKRRSREEYCEDSHGQDRGKCEYPSRPGLTCLSRFPSYNHSAILLNHYQPKYKLNGRDTTLFLSRKGLPRRVNQGA